MKPRLNPTPELLSLAVLQSHVVTTEQVLGHGLGRRSLGRLIAEGRWQRLDAGLYLTSGRPPDWLGQAWGGVLLGGPHARLGGRSAGFLHGLNDEPETIEVLIPWETVRLSRGAWQFTRERSGVRSTRTVGDPPRLTIEDTVLDLTQRASDAEVINMITRAVQTRRTTSDRLRNRMLCRERLHHRRLLEKLLADVAAGAESPLEIDFLRDVERPHGLPIGKRQYRAGKRRLDILYEEFATVVELDGRLGHEGTGRFRDMHRDNAAILSGRIPLRYGWHDVHCLPCQLAAQVATVLAARGWNGLFERCHRCRNVPYFEIG